MSTVEYYLHTLGSEDLKKEATKTIFYEEIEVHVEDHRQRLNNRYPA